MSEKKTMENNIKLSFGYTIIIVVVAILSVLARGRTVAQPPRGHPGVDVKPQETLAAHNVFRADANLAPMVWNETLAAYAQSFANKRIDDCAIVHSGGPYGENIVYGKYPETGMSGPVATQFWLDESFAYRGSTNTCQGVCKDFLQIVWRESVRVGCGSVRCYNEEYVWIICSYDPPGNIPPGRRPY